MSASTLILRKSSPSFEGSKEETITILRNSEFLTILRYPADTLNNVNRFIDEVNKITILDLQKNELLKTELLSALQKKEGAWTDWTLICWPIRRPPFIGTSIDKVLKDKFSFSEYEKLSEQLSANLIRASSAYEYLTKLHMDMEEWVVRGFIDGADYIDMIYKYFDI